ncbi:MAG: DUF4179 domain-containing protein [Pseudobutyrivibrio sp.]|uniref:DUF4179 domain-containing protein n=1 Tax=Pseudobutyrivibrio sp. TaxID=2014367 RepID=UPI001B2C2612|nr:DUF4179 domain-containing protein [Pseudobutyrivibrio sp.]MBO6284006.1 DUF4179 domain-containing protein [Pseudobutyrivibrio sp.]MBP3263134.1 DUF4179 domain-containing protein [Pseudobutyrivibrio sp.]
MDKKKLIISDAEIPTIVQEKVDLAFTQIYEEEERTMKKRSFRLIKTIVATAAALGVVVFSGVCITNPTFAEEVPVVGNVFSSLGHKLGFGGDYEKYAKPIASDSLNEAVALTQTVDGNTVTLQDIYCDEKAMYISMIVESKDPFPISQMYPDLDNKDMYMFYLFDSKLKYSFETEDSSLNNNSLEYLNGEFIDDNTFQGVVKVDLSYVLNYYSKDVLESNEYSTDADTPVSHYDLPDSFTVDLELNSIETDINNPAASELTVEEREALGSKNEYENWWIDGPWHFNFEVNVDRQNTSTQSIDVEGVSGLSKITVSKTPFELELDYDDPNADYIVVALDKDGKHMSAVNNMDMLPVEGHDVSEITLYVCDYNEYMDEIKGQQLDTAGAKKILDDKALWSGVLSF